MNRYGEYGNDAPAHFLFFFLISEIIKIIENKESHLKKNNFILSIFITLNKITMGFAIFIPLIFLNKKKLFSFFKMPKNIFALTFLSLWVLKNLIVSGCLIYPISNLCIQEFEWTNYDQVKIVSQENEAWSKAWPSFKNKDNFSHQEYSKNFIWVDTWLQTHLEKFTKIFLPYIVLLCLLSFILYFKFKSKKISENQHKKKYMFMIFTMILFIIIWFLKIPDYRYGYSYLVSLIALIFAYFCSINNNVNKNAKSFLFSFLIIFIAIFIIKNSIRIINPKDQYFVKFFPKLIFMEKENVKEINLNGLNYLENNDMCGYSSVPCTHYKNLKISSKLYWKYKAIVLN